MTTPEDAAPDEDAAPGEGATPQSGPRAVLRALDLLRAVAARRGGAAPPELGQTLGLPGASLHRLLRTLARGGYLEQRGSAYALGPEAFGMATAIGLARPPSDFPACARPVLEWLARETGETVMLGVLSEQGSEIVYVDVIESQSPLRFTVRTGNRRPLFSVASGKVMLAFSPADAQHRYLAAADFTRFTADTTTRAEMPALLETIRATAAAFDRNGIVEGAAALASPVFGNDGAVTCAVSVAGPTDRMDANRARIEPMVRDAGERLSRIMGHAGAFPPADRCGQRR